MRVALVHDWLTGMRGGEKVLEELIGLWPDAPIYTLVHHPGSVSPLIESREIHTSFVQRLPRNDAYRWYLPLFPAAIERFGFDGYDLVVSSSHCAAKAVITPERTPHVCYCHTPMRYAWDQFDAYFDPRRTGRARYSLIRTIMPWLRRWDRRTADRVDAFAANSGYVAERIRRHYGRDATVIPPPVDVEHFVPADVGPEDYYLVVSALSPYKRVDVAIEAFNRMRRPLVVVGWGPERQALEAMAGPRVRFAGKVSDEELLRLYQRCRGLVLPGVEDAGIAPIEALACGRPALVLGEGGAPEAVVDGVHGVHVEACSPAALAAAVDRAERLTFNSHELRKRAEEYAAPVFAARVRDLVDRTLPDHSAGQAARPDSHLGTPAAQERTT